jgi:hypothetical protein
MADESNGTSLRFLTLVRCSLSQGYSEQGGKQCEKFECFLVHEI